VPNKRPGRHKRPWWKFSEKVISVLVQINVLDGTLFNITVTSDQNIYQFKLIKRFKANQFNILSKLLSKRPQNKAKQI